MVAAEVNSTDPRKKVHPATAGLSAVSRLSGTPTAKATEPEREPRAVGAQQARRARGRREELTTGR